MANPLQVCTLTIQTLFQTYWILKNFNTFSFEKFLNFIFVDVILKFYERILSDEDECRHFEMRNFSKSFFYNALYYYYNTDSLSFSVK